MKIGDGLEVGRRLLFAESAVEVATDSGVAGVAGELADVVDVVDDGFERYLRIESLPGDVTGKEHPAIEGGADHRVTVDEAPDLLVGELPLPRNQSAAVVMAGEHGYLSLIHI